MKNIKKGFTLIELLIVIAIIGILAGVILVSTNTARDKANRANAISSVKSLAPYLAEVSADNGTFIAPTDASTGGGPISSGNTAIWPDLSRTGCAYGTMTQLLMPVTCTAGNFTCTFATGSCN